MKTIALSVALVSGCSAVVPMYEPTTEAPKNYCEKLSSEATTESMAKELFRRTWHTKNLNRELKAIAWQESYFNTRLDHEPSKNGPYQTAFGPLGFKPSTAHLEYKASAKLKKQFPGLNEIEPFLRTFMFNPTFYNELANNHFWRLRKMAGGDAWKAAFGWRWGPGILLGASESDIVADEYVVKYASREGIELPTIQ